MKRNIIILSIFGFVVGMLMTSFISSSFKKTLIENEHNQLLSVAHSSSSHIESYFKFLENTMYTMANSGIIIDALHSFENSFNEISKDGNNKASAVKLLQDAYIKNNPFKVGEKDKLLSSMKADFSYNESHKKFHGYFQKEQKNYGFYDLFIIDKTGNILYTIEKENDFATNLQNGPFSKSNLATLFKKAINLSSPQVLFEDFELYVPSNNAPAAFLAIPLFKEGKAKGVLATQVPVTKIDEVMSFNGKRSEAGLGDSGEAYLVGDNLFMRSNSRFIDSITLPLVQNCRSTVGIIKVDTDSVRNALNGKKGYGLIKDYRGIEVFSAYLPIDVFGNKWAVLAEIDKAEVMQKVQKNTIFLFIISSAIMALFIIGFILIIQRYFIKPLQKQNIELSDDVKIQKNQVLISHSLLNEYKKAVDASAIVSKTNQKGIITYVNDEFCKISGFSNDELIGKSHNIIRHPNTPKATFKNLWETIKAKNIWKGVIQNQKKDGSSYYVNSTIVPMLDEKGNIKEFMSIRSDVTELINKEKKIQEQTTDELTNLPNRIKLSEVIEISKGSMKLAIISLDDINNIDNFYGKEHTDSLIKEVALKLKTLSEIQQTELYRISSDEFALFSKSGLPYDQFIKMCESINEYFSFNNFKISNDEFHVPLTIGVASGEKNLFINAERARYNAQEQDKALVSYDNILDVENSFEENRKWVTKIKEAIRNNKIAVFAQPIVPNGHIKEEKYECLVRLIDPEGKVVSPFYFLDIAKQAHLYISITKIIIEKSFKYFSKTDAVFSINLTIEDILNYDIVTFLTDSMKKYDVAEQLVLEIVESEGIENFDDVSSFIQDMKALGCKIAIDDFGTGYSNFEYLMKLDTDFVKIDGSLIKNIDHDETAQVVVGLIRDFAKKLNLKVIAEYVHNQSVLNKVKELDIEYSQGYYLGEPKIIE